MFGARTTSNTRALTQSSKAVRVLYIGGDTNSGAASSARKTEEETVHGQSHSMAHRTSSETMPQRSNGT
jgi:hypothetical protein